jgi:hypothetical protein
MITNRFPCDALQVGKTGFSFAATGLQPLPQPPFCKAPRPSGCQPSELPPQESPAEQPSAAPDVLDLLDLQSLPGRKVTTALQVRSPTLQRMMVPVLMVYVSRNLMSEAKVNSGVEPVAGACSWQLLSGAHQPRGFSVCRPARPWSLGSPHLCRRP